MSRQLAMGASSTSLKNNCTLPHHQKAWETTRKALLNVKMDAGLLEEPKQGLAAVHAMMLRVNPKYPNQALGLFTTLHKSDAAFRKQFCGIILPYICALAARSAELFPDTFHFPALVSGVNATVELSREQIGCLLACAFFSLHESPPITSEEAWTSVNFERFLFVNSSAQLGKIQCILNYFERLAKAAAARAGARGDPTSGTPPANEECKTEFKASGPDALTGSVIFHRRFVDDKQYASLQWNQLKQNATPMSSLEACIFAFVCCLCPLFGVHASVRGSFLTVNYRVYQVCDGAIEEARGLLQADFANQYIGGGVLETGCVQEEIRFCVSPECLASMHFCSVMQAREAIIIYGAEQFSAYRGYAGGFKFAGDYIDPTPRDSKGRISTAIVAIDALVCFNINQFTKPNITRELVKACAGFHVPGTPFDWPVTSFRGIATGNWGCGVFGGDHHVKAIVQWVAASLAGRSVRYYPFGDKRATGLTEVAAAIADKKATVGDIWIAVEEFLQEREPDLQLFPFLMKRFQ